MTDSKTPIARAARALAMTAALGLTSGCGGCCFGPSAQIATPRGPRRIADLRPGDRVLAWSFAEGTAVERTVTRTIQGIARGRLHLTLADGVISAVTRSHPFWVPASSTWRTAGELRAGDELSLLGPDGALRTTTIRHIEPLADEPGALVHNLTVEGEENFFVEGILVHNKSPANDDDSGWWSDDDDSTADESDDDDSTGDDDDSTGDDDDSTGDDDDDDDDDSTGDDDDATWPGLACPGDDGAEPNDSWDTPAALPPTGTSGDFFVLCPGNEDYFLAGDDDDSATIRVTSLNGTGPVMIRKLDADTGWTVGEYLQGPNGYAITTWFSAHELVQIVQQSGDDQVDYRVNFTIRSLGDP